MVGYTIHYTDNDGNIGTDSANADSASDNIAINDNVIYTVTVEARSQLMSGKSEPIVYEPGKPIPHYVTVLYSSYSQYLIKVFIIIFPSSHNHRSTSRYTNECDGC